ncbi:MAG: EAL domain-containing protein, partial [Betaproteobacteria bacterium]
PDIVKLDRSLIVQATENPRVRRVLPKIVEIVHDLNARVVCEGVETREQHAIALDSGVDLLQGFYYARPSPEVELKLKHSVSSSFDFARVAQAA